MQWLIWKILKPVQGYYLISLYCYNSIEKGYVSLAALSVNPMPLDVYPVGLLDRVE